MAQCSSRSRWLMRVEVRVQRRAGLVAVEVCDDGVGRVDPGRGSSPRGLADRVEALQGWLQGREPAGGGMHLLAEIPLSQPDATA
jgi:two-component system sensor histidine kinase DesK